MLEEDRQLVLKVAGSIIEQLTKLSKKECPLLEIEEPYKLDTLSEYFEVSWNSRTKLWIVLILYTHFSFLVLSPRGHRLYLWDFIVVGFWQNIGFRLYETKWEILKMPWNSSTLENLSKSAIGVERRLERILCYVKEQYRKFRLNLLWSILLAMETLDMFHQRICPSHLEKLRVKIKLDWLLVKCFQLRP